MPTFDVVSEVDEQEVKNAVDQAQRELATRFDFKGTDSSIELGTGELTLRSSTEDRLRAVQQVLEEKLVRRGVSLKALDYGKVEEAAKGTVRQTVTLTVGISSEKAKAINKFLKERLSDAAPLPRTLDVHRVLDRRRVGGPVAERRQRTESDDDVALDGDHRRVRAGVGDEPSLLVLDRALDEVERGHAADLDVVDGADRLGVVEPGESHLHTGEPTGAPRRHPRPRPAARSRVTAR